MSIMALHPALLSFAIRPSAAPPVQNWVNWVRTGSGQSPSPGTLKVQTTKAGKRWIAYVS